MQSYLLADADGLDGLTLVERPTPKPGPGEVLIEMRAASLNYRDLLVTRGLYPDASRPLVPLSDGVGIVADVGVDVTRVARGDRVAGIFDQSWLDGALPELGASLGGQVDGVLAQYVLLPEDGVVHVPAGLTDEQAATLPCAAVTAWNALMVHGRIRPGMSVLVQGSGGVSMFAMQFARMAGARVIALSGSDEKTEVARRVGADEAINYRETPDWAQRVAGLTEGAGVDHVVDIGGAETLARSVSAVRKGGAVSLIGLSTGMVATLHLPELLVKQVRLQGIYVGSRASFEQMNRAIESNGLQPVVDAVFEFEDAIEAYHHLQSGDHVGKVCVRF